MSNELLLNVKNKIAIASGKGGVGKSTVAVNLAAALVKEGYKTGLIDADIYGPSIPMMLNAEEKPKIVKIENKNKLLPLVRFGIKLMSIGFLVDKNEAVVWRGPMASAALKQFMTDVEWDELDFLLYDMPPGTGDIQLTLTQTIPLTGAIIVTTPQDISLADARKGARMFGKVNVPVLGIIENMSYYINPDGSKEFIFGEGGGERLSQELGVNYLGQIVLNKNIRIAGDEGIPVVLKEPDSFESRQFLEIAQKIAFKIKDIKSIPKTEISLE